MKAIKDVIFDAKYSNDQDQVVRCFYDLNNNLKRLHNNVKCTNGIDIQTKIDEENNVFLETRYMTDSSDVKKDLDDFALLAISSFVFLNSDSKQFVPITKEVVQNNVDFINEMIPSITVGDRYYTDVIENNVFTYYEDYLTSLQMQNGSNLNNSLTKNKSTAAGRALSDRDNYDAAFIDIMFYPVIISAILIITAVIYVSIDILT